MSSSIYEPLGRGEKVRKRKPRKKGVRKPYVPSTIGSATESRLIFVTFRFNTILIL